MDVIKFCLTGCYPADIHRIGGGVEHVTHLLSQTFGERTDIDLQVVGLIRHVDINDIVDVNGVRIHRVGLITKRFSSNLLAAGASLAPLFQELKPDVVNSHDVVMTDAALRAGCRVVHTIHGVKHKESPYFSGRQRIAAVLHTIVERRIVARADAVISVAQYGLDCFSKSIKGPSYVIDVPIEDVFYGVSEMRPCKGILFVGNVGRRKNIQALVHTLPTVLAKHPDAILHVCGGVIQQEYMARIQQFIDSHGIGGSVVFHGVVDRNKLCELLDQSISLVLPSYQETSPGVICQAMAAGRVPIASFAGGIPEMIDEGHTGYLVEADDSDTLAERLIDLMNDFDKAKAMGAAAKEVAKRYDRHAVADRILRICSTLVDNTNSPLAVSR